MSIETQRLNLGKRIPGHDVISILDGAGNSVGILTLEEVYKFFSSDVDVLAWGAEAIKLRERLRRADVVAAMAESVLDCQEDSVRAEWFDLRLALAKLESLT